MVEKELKFSSADELDTLPVAWGDHAFRGRPVDFVYYGD